MGHDHQLKIKLLDTITGIIIFGVAGALIGFYLNHWAIIWGGLILGCVLGGFISRLGARRFFMSVLVGTLLGGLLGWLAGGSGVVPVTAGTGSAIGGFIGINIELFMRFRHGE
jgi:hypothetical protein